MNCEPDDALMELAQRDQRYPVDAYRFVREALSYASDILEMGSEKLSDPDESPQPKVEHHLTGQELCEAIRVFSLNQFGMMAQAVLKNWNIEATSDIGAIVYNMIGVGLMNKSKGDDQRHFDNVFDFETAFQNEFNFCKRKLKTKR